jgi:hypothetical protein
LKEGRNDELSHPLVPQGLDQFLHEEKLDLLNMLISVPSELKSCHPEFATAMPLDEGLIEMNPIPSRKSS